MADVPVPETTAEEEFELFGPGPAAAAHEAAAQQGANPFAPVHGPSPAPTQAQPSEPAAGSPTGTTVPPVQSPKASAPPVQSPKAAAPSSSSGSAGFTPEQMPGFMMELLRQQREMMAMNQQLVATMLRRMDLEEERRNKAEEKVLEAAEAAKQAADAPASSSAASSAAPASRAEKYLPNLPVIDHQGMGKGRMKEVETWHSFMETLSSWLALQEEAFVRELQLCIPVKKEIVQADLNPETALKLYQHVGHLKRPTDLIRHLEDSFSKSEAKLSNFPELLLSEADRCSVLLQSLGAEVRQYVVLHGSSSNWEALRRTLTYYEEQLRLCEVPGSSGRALQEKLCDYCGKKGHTADKCWQRQKEERERGGAPKGKEKGDKGKPKGKGDQTPKGSGTPRGSEKGKGDKGKGDKGKDKGKKQKKKKGQPGKGRSLTEPESEAESGGRFRVVKKYDRTANLFNASGGAIVVSGVVDLEVHFGDVFLRLEEVLVADVGFNVVSPWTGSERGWKTYLAKSGSRLYKGNGKKSIKLMGASRAWWALSGRSKGRGKENSSRRPPKGIDDMEIDQIDALKDRDLLGSSKESTAGPQKPGEGILKKGRKTSEEDESGLPLEIIMDGASGDEFTPSVALSSPGSPGNPPTPPALESPSFELPGVEPPGGGPSSPVAVYPSPVVTEAAEESDGEESWGTQWPNPSKRLRAGGPSEVEGPVPPRAGIPANISPGSLSPPFGAVQMDVGTQLLLRALRLEAGRRWEHAETLGLAKVSSVALALGHALRALCSPAATMLGPIGLPDLEHPAAWLPATPVIPVTAAYPEEPVRASRPKMVESESQCIIGQQEWEVWLGRCLEGKSLAEYGLHMVDLEFAVRVTELLEAPRAARAAWKRRFQEPNPVSMLHYIFHCRAVLQTYLATPAGYKGLVGGRSSLLVKVPQSVTSLELKTAWAFLDSGIYLRVARYYRRKREEERLHEARESMRAARAKSAAIPQGGVVDTTSSSSDEESLLLGEGELTALNRAQGQEDLSDLAIWRTLEELTGQRLSQLDGYVGAADEGNQPAEAGQPAPPSPASSMPPGELVATAFNLPRVSAPTLPEGMQREDYRRHGVNIPPSVPKRSRLPTPPRAMSAAASGSATGEASPRRGPEIVGVNGFTPGLDIGIIVRKLQRENQTIGLDFFYFGKLRVLLMMHLGSKYTVSLPAMHLDDPDLLHNINRVIREMGLVGKAVTFRMDQEAALGALAEKLTKCDSSPASATLIDVVPGYRPQSKGSIERQVETMKQGFWSVWLDLEKEVAKVKQETEAVELGKYRLPLGGLLWQACVFYVARCYNLWCTSVGDSSTSIDRLHEEIVNRTRTRPFGCLVQAQVSKSKAHHDKFRGARTVKAVYLGPVHAKGGGIFAVPVGSSEIDIFSVARMIQGGDIYDAKTLEELSLAKPLLQDTEDPERPILFDPLEAPGDDAPDEGAGVGMDEDGDEEMIEDELGDCSPSEAPENQEVVNDEGDMEIDWLTNHYLESLFRGPDLRAASTAVAKSFDLKFGGTKIRCAVPQDAVSETSGEKLEPDLLYASMKLELEELESFKVGEVIPEREARRLAKENGRRVLTSLWVNTVKKKGLYRSRLVVRDYASMGGTTLSEGIYSPTTSLEGLRLLLSMLCRRGSVLSCDVSVAFMHAPVARAEFVELPNNVSTQGTGERVFVKLRKAMNGLRSAPLSWYCELAEYLRSQNFEASLDPTIFRRLTRKGLTIVLFYVDDLLIYSEDEAEGRRFYEELRKRYKLKLTGELIQDCPGEVSFLGRRIFRRKKGERTVYFGLDEQYLSSCCEEYGITKPAPKLPSLERRYAELLKKGQTEPISPAAHERYRRTLGRLAWAALSRPDLQFVCGFLGRHQAAPDEAAETCMRDVLRWVKGLPHKVQRFPSKREILEDDADPASVSCFTDASWSLNSVSGGIITWENCSLKSFSRKQTTTALSSAEAELAALTEVAREGLYIALLVETIREGADVASLEACILELSNRTAAEAQGSAKRAGCMLIAFQPTRVVQFVVQRGLDRPPRQSKERKPGKAALALHTVWEKLTPEARLAIEEAGWRPPSAAAVVPPPGLGDFDVDMDASEACEAKQKLWSEATEQQKELMLKAGLKPPEQTPAPTSYEVGTAANAAFRKATVALKLLGDKKISLQKRIDQAKEQYNARLTEMKQLQTKIEEAQQQVADAGEELTTKVLAQDESLNGEIAQFLEKFGISLTEEQEAKIAAVRAGTHGPPDSQAFDLKAAAPNTQEVPKKSEPAQNGQRGTRSRSPRKTQEAAAEKEAYMYQSILVWAFHESESPCIQTGRKLAMNFHFRVAVRPAGCTQADQVLVHSTWSGSALAQSGDPGVSALWASLLQGLEHMCHVQVLQAVEALEAGQYILEDTFPWFAAELAVEAGDDVPWHVAASAIRDVIANLESNADGKKLLLVSSNVTKWRKSLATFLAGIRPDLWLVQETHIKEEQGDLLATHVGAFGYQAFSLPGHPTGGGGNSGGLAIVFKKHLDVRKSHHFLHQGVGFQSVVLRIRGVDIFLVNVYLKTGEGFRGPTNAIILSNLIPFLRSLQGEFLVAGDFNEDISVLVTTSLAQEARGQWVHTGASTCTGGGNIDFGLVSKGLALGVSVRADWITPFAPHAALHWCIDRRQCELRFPQLVGFKPKPIMPQPFEPPFAGCSGPQPDLESACAGHWGGSIPEPALTHTFEQLSSSVELSVYGCTQGRGCLPKFRRDKLLRHTSPVGAWGGAQASFWKRVLVWLELSAKRSCPAPFGHTFWSQLELMWHGSTAELSVFQVQLDAVLKGATPSAFPELIQVSEQQFRHHSKLWMQKQSASYGKWLKQASCKGLRGLFTSVKADEAVQLRPFLHQPVQERIYLRWRQWFELWSAPGGVDPALLSDLRQRARMQAKELGPIPLDQAVAAFKRVPSKAPGLDGWTFEMLIFCSDRLLHPSFHFFTTVKLRWKLVSDWQFQYCKAAVWDKAMPGSQVLDVALGRLLRGEAARQSGQHLVTIFIDMETFYDRCRFNDVISSGLSLGYPPLVLHQALLTYMGPRFLQSEGSLCPAITPTKGVLAGCPAAPSISKLVVHPIAVAATSKRATSNLDVWIDDLSLDCVGASAKQIASDAVLLFRSLRTSIEATGARDHRAACVAWAIAAYELAPAAFELFGRVSGAFDLTVDCIPEWRRLLNEDVVEADTSRSIEESFEAKESNPAEVVQQGHLQTDPFVVSVSFSGCFEGLAGRAKLSRPEAGKATPTPPPAKAGQPAKAKAKAHPPPSREAWKDLRYQLGSLKKAGKGANLRGQWENCKTQSEKRTFYYEVFLLDPEVSRKEVHKVAAGTSAMALPQTDPYFLPLRILPYQWHWSAVGALDASLGLSTACSASDAASQGSGSVWLAPHSPPPSTRSASSQDSSLDSAVPGLRYRHPLPWSPFKVPLLWLLQPPLYKVLWFPTKDLREPFLGWSLEGLLFGDQRAQRSPWPSYANSPALQWNQGQPTANMTNLSAMGRMNAGLSGPLAFDPDTSSAYDALQPQPSTQDFSQEPPLKSRQCTRIGILEADRRGAQQALWHHSRRAHEQPRLLPSFALGLYQCQDRRRQDPPGPDLRQGSRVAPDPFPTIAVYFTEAAVDACQYQGPSALLDSEGDPEA
ncbi:unnamed protein product [Symbiodinium sp. CCMP2592]|nr:unnamed protein product [Symbiodinium sp. CCMP2592]